MEWNGGYITGSGLVPLLKDVKDHCTNSNISSTDELIQIANDSKSRFFSRIDMSNAEKEFWFKNTGWMFTYLSVINERGILRLAHMRPENNYQIVLLPQGKATIWAKGKKVNTITSNLEKNMVLFDGDPFEEESVFKESLRVNEDLVKIAFSKVSLFDDSVCKDYSLGIQILDGNTSRIL